MNKTRKLDFDYCLGSAKRFRSIECVFSSTSDFGLIKKSVSLYRKVCSICDVSPDEVIHAGDDQCFDFEVPCKLGITAFYLDRTSEHSGDHVINSLKQLTEKLDARALP